MRENAELIVITKAKKLIEYILTASEAAPKKYRFTFVSRMQNISLDIAETLILANEIMLGVDSMSDEERKGLQLRAIAKLKVLDCVAMASRENHCLLPKQYEIISRLISDCINLTAAWMNSDKKRYKG